MSMRIGNDIDSKIKILICQISRFSCEDFQINDDFVRAKQTFGYHKLCSL